MERNRLLSSLLLLPLALLPVRPISARYRLIPRRGVMRSSNAHTHLQTPCNSANGSKELRTKAILMAHPIEITWSVSVDSTCIKPLTKTLLQLEWQPHGCKVMIQSQFSISNNPVFQSKGFRTAYVQHFFNCMFHIIPGWISSHSQACATAWFLLVTLLMTMICVMTSWHFGTPETPPPHYLYGETHGMQKIGKSPRALHKSGNGYSVTHRSY